MLGEQFHLFDPGPASPQAGPVRRSATVDKLTELAIERFPHEPPVGMRGSIPERAKLADRISRRDQNRSRWDSYRSRIQDSYHEDQSFEINPSLDQPAITLGTTHPRDTHPRTGLPSIGEIDTGPKGIGFSHDAIIPQEATYHGAARSAWAKFGRTTFVPTPLLRTSQREVSAQRLHETIERPETRDANELHGLPKGLPEVFHDRMHDAYTISEGNHRLSADLLQGHLFSEVRLMDNRDLPKARKQTTRINKARARAERNVDMDEVERRSNNLFYGSGNW